MYFCPNNRGLSPLHALLYVGLKIGWGALHVEKEQSGKLWPAETFMVEYDD